LFRSGAVLEAPAVVAGFDDVAVVRKPVEERRGHLGIGEDAGPFTKGEIGRYDNRRVLVKAADQVKQQLAAGLGERQIAEFVELCCAQHNSTYVKPAFTWSSLKLGLPAAGFCGSFVLAAPHNHQSRRSQPVMSSPRKTKAPPLGGASTSGKTCARACRFRSRSARAYRMVVFRFAWPSH